MNAGSHEARAGLAYGLAAYGWWGLVAIYFRAVSHVAPLEVLAHRTVWSLALLGVWLALRRRAKDLLAPLRDRKALVTLLATSALIATNWFTFIWSVTTRHVVQASLGYFVNPLISVALARVFLGERLRPLQRASVVIAGGGVGWQAWSQREVPTVALVLALSFGLYGLLRKKADVGGLEGLLLEVAMLSPLAVAYLLVLGGAGTLAFGSVSRGTDVLLVLGGVVTALPLVWFVEAARRLPLVTVGFLQFISPSIQLVLATLAFGEPFTRDLAVTFSLIWAALALFAIDAVQGVKSSPVRSRPGTHR